MKNNIIVKESNKLQCLVFLFNELLLDNHFSIFFSFILTFLFPLVFLTSVYGNKILQIDNDKTTAQHDLHENL